MGKEKYSEEENIKKYVENQEQGNNPKKTQPIGSEPLGTNITDTSGVKKPWEHSEERISKGNEIGWQELKLEDFPTRGMFYPEGTQIFIRAALASEIRHWSTLNENDLSLVDDMLNYILERCVTIKYPQNKMSSWRDIKEVDRFYVLLAVRELTFIKGENKLQIKISENEKIDVTKEMIDYINFTEDLLKRYDEEKRCFKLQFKSGNVIYVDIPSVGVTNWLKNYVNRKERMQEAIDRDFLGYAPFVIRDWKGLNDVTYSKYVLDSNSWTVGEISALTHIKELFAETVDPVVKYKDDQGGERVVPLSFQGGIKSIFLISDPFGELV